jgi:hypothetical protein
MKNGARMSETVMTSQKNHAHEQRGAEYRFTTVSSYTMAIVVWW